METLYLLLILIPVLLIGFGISWFFLAKKRKSVQFSQSLKMSLFLVKMPKYEKKAETDRQEIKSLIEVMEQFYSNFLYLKKPKFLKKLFYRMPRVALEIASEVGGEDIAFYVAVPASQETALEKYIQGVYPHAVVEKVPQDYTVFEPNCHVAAATLFLKKSLYFPINTYKKLESDPLSAITNALSKIEPEEGSAIQIILKPASSDKKKKGDKIISQVTEKGKNIRTAISQAGRSKFGDFVAETLATLSSAKKTPPEEYQKRNKEGGAGGDLVEAVRVKMQKPLFDVNIRLIGVAKEKERAEEILSHLEGAFSQFVSAVNGFRPRRIKKRGLKRFLYNFTFRNFSKQTRVVLNLEELTSVYHFPLSHIASPHIKWAKTKEAAPPSELSSTGLNLLGKAVFRGSEKSVFFSSRVDRRRHFYVIGQTGTGKTSLLREMIRQDMEAGEGVGVIDPHGDLIEDTLANVPKERIEDVILFEPFDMERPCGLNMLEWKTPEQKDFAISEMITIFSKLFPPEVIGPMFEHYMRNAMLALMAYQEDPGTLVEIPRIFTDDEFMKKRLRKVTDPIVRSFWLKEWAQTTGQTKSDMLGYVVSKVGRFIENEMVRNIIGQSRSSFDLEDIMNGKKIFLANLSKGLTGEMNSSLLGLILVSKMQMAALKRGRIPQEERQDFYLYIDEFQNFTTDSIATILSEARKYRLNLILAHQFMPQLTEEIRAAVIGNVGSMASFRVGAEDAEFLEKQFDPDFSRFDLLNLDNFQFICKMMINNNVSSSFKAKTIIPKEGNKEAVATLKQLSKLKYSRPKAIIEQEIRERSQLGI